MTTENGHAGTAGDATAIAGEALRAHLQVRGPIGDTAHETGAAIRMPWRTWHQARRRLRLASLGLVADGVGVSIGCRDTDEAASTHAAHRCGIVVPRLRSGTVSATTGALGDARESGRLVLSIGCGANEYAGDPGATARTVLIALAAAGLDAEWSGRIGDPVVVVFRS